jgi:DNA-binding CsgD family transcriptional regulator/PAS domain-containing protein
MLQEAGMGIVEEGQQAELVCRLFEAAVEPQRWQGVSAQIAQAFDAGSGTLMVLRPRAAASLLDATGNFAGAPALAYQQHYRQCDVWTESACLAAHRGARIGAELVPESAFQRTEFYADFCRPAGIYHALGCVVHLPGGEFGLLAVHRPRTQRAFTQQDKQRLERLVPYFERALALRARMREAGLPEQCSMAALDCIGTAVLLVDAQMRLLHANAAAAALLGRDSALRLCGGKLLQDGATGTQSLARAVQGVFDPLRCAAPMSLQVARRCGPPLLLAVAPYLPPAELPWRQPCAIVMASEPGAQRLSRAVLGQLFGLTPAEAGVAQALAHGEALDGIASALEISLHTVKTHLQHLFRKTGTRRQGELVAVLHGSPAALLRSAAVQERA